VFQVSVPFFFEGIPGGNEGDAHLPKHVNEFLATTEGLALAKAFTRIRSPALRRTISALVEDLAEHAPERH
jgi:hypothetical protein